jgi:hypothetical protein
MTIQSIREWSACRQIPNWSRQHNEAEKIFKSASSDHLDELIAIVQSGEPADQHVALSVLEHFARAKYDLRWTRERNDRLVHALRKQIVDKYPHDISRHAVQLLREMDFSWLDEFLASFPLEQISDENCPALIWDLSNQLTEAARAQLLLMAEAGWKEALQIKWTVNAPPGSLRTAPPVDERHYNPPTRLSGPLVGSPEWQRLKTSQNSIGEIALWFRFLTPQDIADLATAWDGDNPDDRRCAGHVLREAAQKQDSRLATVRERILRRAESLASPMFEETGTLPSEYYVIQDLDRERAVDFVLARLDQPNLSPRHAHSLFRVMRRLKSPRIIARAQELAGQSGPLAKDAETYLDDITPVMPERMEAVAERWRQEHSARDLKWIYFRHLDPTAAGADIGPILKLLGEPSEQGQRFYSWKSNASPVRLHLETNTDGNLNWMKLYDESE